MKTQLTTFLCCLILLPSLLMPGNATAGGTYQEPAQFIDQLFNGQPPKASVLWLNKDLKKQMAETLGHAYRGMRVRYWLKEGRSAWILEEIGKEKNITTGIVIKDRKIEQVKVLIFRESRGWEIRHEFFTDQFKGAELKDNSRLSRHIDNISGATLSVRAVKKLAQIALLLDKSVQPKDIETR